MNFGVRLPGPFRVGVNTKTGRVTGGVNVGPFSVSGNIGKVSRPVPGATPWTLDQAAEAAEAEGWTITARNNNGMTVQRGWRGAYVRAVPGGVTITRAMPTRVLGVIVFGSLVAIALFVIMTVSIGG